MTVPRKIPVHIQERNDYYILGPMLVLIVGTVHNPRQGGINSFPL